MNLDSQIDSKIDGINTENEIQKIKEHKKCTQENGNLSTFFVYRGIKVI